MKLSEIMVETYSKNPYKLVPYEKKKLDKNGDIIFKYLDKKISFPVREVLSYLIHDKAHVLSVGNKDKDMEWVFKNLSTKCNIPLYRGVNKKELQMLLDGKPINWYTSYSEKKETAAAFGTVVTLLPPMNAFCYYDFMIKLASEDAGNPEQDEEQIEALLLEKEWLLPFNLELEVVDAKKRIFKIKD